jgi:hypothetical protein
VAAIVLVAGAHRHADLARLWYRSVARDVLPAFERAGARAEAVLFRDTDPESFPARWFEGATLAAPRSGVRDFIEFYDSLLERTDASFILLLDADLFLLDADWAAAHLSLFADPALAAVSFLRRTAQPGVYALLVRRSAYAALPPPVFAPAYERLDAWPHAVNLQPGDASARALRSSGQRILDVPRGEAETRIADFHGTTVIRISREMVGGLLGERFDTLVSEKPYFAMGAYDNLLLGTLYRSLYGAPFAPGPDGVHLSSSATPEVLRAALSRIKSRTALSRLVDYFDRSDRALSRLAAREGVTLAVPGVLSRKRRFEARAWGALRRALRRPP